MGCSPMAAVMRHGDRNAPEMLSKLRFWLNFCGPACDGRSGLEMHRRIAGHVV